jgi:hypothetical protein
MFRALLPIPARIWRKGHRRTATPRPAALRRVRPTLEALEDRLAPSLGALVSYNAGSQTFQGSNGFTDQVATGDLNGDGKLDLAVTNTADNTVNILLGNADGTFQPAVSYATGLGGPVWVSIADFNRDGRPDLAVEDSGGGSLSILLNNGDGTFQAAVTYAAGSLDRGGLAVGDFFGNGKLDLAVADFGSGEIGILPGNGDGTFGSLIGIPVPTSAGPVRSIVAGDFGNGHIDLALAGGQGYDNQPTSADPACAAIFLNDGSGNFTFAGSYVATPTPDPGGGSGQGDIVNPEHINAADLRHNGITDLVISDYDHNIDVFLGNGNGTFQSAVGYTTETAGQVGGYPRGVDFADLNHDGKLDIVADDSGNPNADQSTPEPGSVGVLYGNGDGTFQAPVQYTPYQFPGSVATGDFNGDGWSDVAVTQNFDGHSVGVLLNQPHTANQPPTVRIISPAVGPTGGGNQVTITGTNFTGTTQVYFGTTPAAAFTVRSDATIVATAPVGAAGTVDVTVYNAGASAVTAADEYTYATDVVTWTGLGTTTNWSDAANWSTGAVPDAAATVVFDGTSSKNATVDAGFAGTVAGVEIDKGYSGTVALNEGLTVTGTFTEQAGTYNANGYTTAVTGLTTVSGGAYLTATGAQTFTGGLTVAGGKFTGSTGTVTTANVTLAGGNLTAPSGTLDVTGGNFTYTAGTFNANRGTVTYTGNGTAPTLSLGTGRVRFWNFQDAMTTSYPGGMTVTGTLTVASTFSWLTGSGPFWGNIEAQGNVDDQNHGGTGNPYLTLDGSRDQKIEDTSGGGGGDLRTLTINKSAGAVILVSDPLVYGTLTFTAGVVKSGAHTWRLGGQGPVSATDGLNLGNVEIDGANVTVGSADLQVANLTFASASDGFTAPTGNLLVSGNWNDSAGGSFSANGGTVVFDGGKKQLLTSGGQDFNDLTIAAGTTLILEADVTVTGTFTNLGTFVPNGHSILS